MEIPSLLKLRVMEIPSLLPSSLGCLPHLYAATTASPLCRPSVPITPHNHFPRPKAVFLPQTSNREKGLAFFSHCKTVSSPLDLDSSFPDLKFDLPDLLCTVSQQPSLVSDLVCLTGEEKMGGFHHSHLHLVFSSSVFKQDVGEFVLLRTEVGTKVWNALFVVVGPAMLQEKLIFGVQSCILLQVWCGKHFMLIPRGLGLLIFTKGYKALPWKPPDAESFHYLLFYLMFLLGALPQIVFGNQHFLLMTPFPEVAQHQALRDLVDYVTPPVISFWIVPQSHFDAWGLIPFIGIGKDVKGRTLLVYVDPGRTLLCYSIP